MWESTTYKKEDRGSLYVCNVHYECCLPYPTQSFGTLVARFLS
jgi:hypothetical protein